MWSTAIILDFLAGACKVIARWLRLQITSFPPGGSGPWAPARHHTAPNLPLHTIYSPVNLAEGDRLPLLVWANGFGLAWGLTFSDFLREVASHGYIVIANGTPRGLGITDEKGQISAVEWAQKTTENSKDIRKHIDTSRIALAGQSKGGVHTYRAADTLQQNPALKTIALFNAGLMRPRPGDIKMLRRLKVPIYYFTGDDRDVLYRNARRDWGLVPDEIPAYLASLDAGHLGTFYEEAGGLFAQATVNWLDTELKGDQQSRASLLRESSRWRIMSKNL